MGIKQYSVEIEELRQIKINLEGTIVKWQAEDADWKKKYENEARLRVEETDALKKKFTIEINGLTDACHNLEQKLKATEGAKLKLSSEVGVLIKDFEHSQVVIKELTSKLQLSDKTCNDLSIKLKEMTNLYESADKDNKARGNEIVKLNNDMDRLAMGNQTLTQVKGKLEDDLKALKMELDALKKRYTDTDRENRKLVHEREELARAYKDADAGKVKALEKVAILEKELSKFKAEFEKKFGGARDEYEAAKKKLAVEIESLTKRLHETDYKLKNEVEVIKKKMSVTITELEMSLDGSNKNNAQLQNTAKIQAQKILELSAAYEGVNKKLGDSLNQYDITVKHLQKIELEFKNLNVTYSNTIKISKDYELKLSVLMKQVTDLTAANNNLGQFKIKIEKELAIVNKDYSDIAREPKLADDRANKAGSDAAHFESLLREEQNKLVKIDGAKKALENECRSQELEIMINEEKKLHVASISEIQIRNRQIKEFVLQSEEDRKNIIILQESLEKLNEKIKMYKRQLEEQESISNSNIMRVKKFQRELESSESRAEEAESTLNQF